MAGSLQIIWQKLSDDKYFENGESEAKAQNKIQIEKENTSRFFKMTAGADAKLKLKNIYYTN